MNDYGVINMNERIRELSHQAGLPKYITREIGPTVIQKFAELIVEECINICISNRDDASADHIEKHFGVEE